MTTLKNLNAGDTLLQRFTLLSAFTQHVWIAYDNKNENKVILKHAEAQLLHREWSCLSQCHSPYIISVIEYLPNSSLLISPFLRAQSLLTLTQDDGDLFISFLPQIVRAITHLHLQGWVHGDIKPSNIIYQPQLALIKIIDFGAAQPLGEALSELQKWQLTVGFSQKNKQLGIGKIETNDDWFALQQWLMQINPLLLTQRNQSKLKQWNNWLKLQLN